MEPDVHGQPLLRNVNTKWGRKKNPKTSARHYLTLIIQRAVTQALYACQPLVGTASREYSPRCQPQGTDQALPSSGHNRAGGAVSSAEAGRAGPVHFCARPAPPNLHNFSCKLLEAWTQPSAASPGSTGLQLSPLVGFKNSTKHQEP